MIISDYDSDRACAPHRSSSFATLEEILSRTGLNQARSQQMRPRYVYNQRPMLRF